ncbi:MAG: hypothetical protein ABI398_01830 [Devosia sp.]
MKSVRLLPIVIFAALALLVFKGLGLLTNGGYVLIGPAAAVAEDSAPPGAGMPSTPSEALMSDASPTMDDTAPTLATRAEASSDAASSDEHGSSGDAHGSSSDAGSSMDPSMASSGSSAPSSEAAMSCPDSGPSPAASSEPAAHEPADKASSAATDGCPPPATVTNAHGDAVPTIKDGTGKIIPLSVAEGGDSQAAVLQRLGERRADLDKRQAELDMRASLVAAAEQKLDQRTTELKDLEAQVKALVDEKQAAEDAGFKGIVSMYETMKPKDAAKIFDTLDLNVLLKVARAMNPRKMSPVLAAMSPQPAEALTTAFASTDNTNVAMDTSGGQNLAALPQIVGH